MLVQAYLKWLPYHAQRAVGRIERDPSVRETVLSRCSLSERVKINAYYRAVNTAGDLTK